MMKRFKWIICFFVLFLFLEKIEAQPVASSFFLTGSLKVDQGVVDGAQIQFYRDEALSQTITLNRTGNFRYQVQLNHIYKIVFSKSGYYYKSIIFDTHVPDDVCKVNCEFAPYQLLVGLLKSVPGVDQDMLQSQIGTIRYNKRADNFTLEQDEEKTNYGNELEDDVRQSRDKSKKYEAFEIRNQQQRYDSIILVGDRYFANNQHAEAMKIYRDAVLCKQSQEYPRSRVDQCYRILVQEELQKAYGQITQANVSKYLNYADQKYKEREFTVALVAYQQVSVILAGDVTIKEKLQNSVSQVNQLKQLAIDEVRHREESYQSRKVKYDDFTQKADKLFISQKFSEAKDLYAEAAMLIDERSHAVGMIRKIDELLGSDEAAQLMAKKREDEEKFRIQMVRDQAYHDAISEADISFAQRKYRDALEYYELALTIKNYEIYPRKQMISIKAILVDLESKGIEYNNFIREADELFYKKQFPEARVVYENAHNLIRNEVYAFQKMKEIDQILASLNLEKENEEKYKEALVKADDLFKSKNYHDAIAAYQSAQSIKPQEFYPAQQIKIIRDIMARSGSNQPALSQIQREYDNEIMLADNSFQNQVYQLAQIHYQKALALIPGQEYPLSQLRKISQLVEHQEKMKKSSILERIDFANLDKLSKQDRDEAYKEAMRLGEAFLGSKEWGVSRFYFRRALALKPNDVSANQRIDQVEALIRGGDVNEARYTDMIQKADEAFITGDFSVSKFYYAKALEAKPNDSYVNERLKTIDQLTKTAQQRESSKEFEGVMEKANAAFDGKNYSVARFFYRKAQSIRPNDPQVLQRLKAIEEAINKN